MTTIQQDHEPDFGAEAPKQSLIDVDSNGVSQRIRLEHQSVVLQSVIKFQDHNCLTTGLLALADWLRQHFSCQRVCVGLWNGKTTAVSVISQQATIDATAAETRLLNAAMTEVCHIDSLLHLGSANAQTGKATLFNGRAHHSTELPTPAHWSLAAGRRNIQIVTLPLCHHGRIQGALLLEATTDVCWEPEKFELLQQVSDLLAPMIATRREAERSVTAHLFSNVRQYSESLTAPTHLRIKICALITLVCLLAFAAIPVAQRVSAPAELVPVQLRTVSAPVDGYIQNVLVRAGDHVEPGQLLMSLDKRELELQLDKSRDELSRLNAELRVARATGNRKQTVMLKAQYSQEQSQSELLEQRIERSAVRAPHAGLIVSADLTQMTGAPLERGQRLLEIAPDTRYTVNLMVDERDINLISPGQRGKLSLQANPADQLVLEVDRIHPIGLAEDGQNRFRVEASLTNAPQNLLPGQTGIAKVQTGKASMLDNWSRHFRYWLTLKHWTWFG